MSAPIRIWKLAPDDMPWFDRRWVASRAPDDDGVAEHILGYFSSQQGAIDLLENPVRIVDATPAGESS